MSEPEPKPRRKFQRLTADEQHKVAAAVQSGKTYAEAGGPYGVSYQVVYLICKRYGVRSPNSHEVKCAPELRANVFDDCEKGDSYREVGRRYRLHWQTVRKLYFRERERRGLGKPDQRRRYNEGNEAWKALSDQSAYTEWKGSVKKLCKLLGVHYVGKKKAPNVCRECGKTLSGENKTGYCSAHAGYCFETDYHKQGRYCYARS